MSYMLVDAHKLNKENPETFHIPSQKELANIKVGNFVKVAFVEILTGITERMWLEVVEIKDNQGFVGRLDNEPSEMKSIKINTIVSFSNKNIYSIFDK